MSKLTETEPLDIQQSRFCAYKILARKISMYTKKAQKHQKLFFKRKKPKSWVPGGLRTWNPKNMPEKTIFFSKVGGFVLKQRIRSCKPGAVYFWSHCFYIRLHNVPICNRKKYETTKHQYCEFPHNFTHLLISFFLCLLGAYTYLHERTSFLF